MFWKTTGVFYSKRFQGFRRIKEQTELNNTITEMKNTLEGINNRITEAEEWVSDLEDRMWNSLLRNRIRKKSFKLL